ncbi:cutinase family protein [Corynebacterium senegalense]|uniref:cutinase family protein n=1 Tax=Corynebacterium senegalense TaxID=2080750 RepID=UPI0015F26162|nr:cutinase family protein [Corynebacterium senegalense]
MISINDVNDSALGQADTGFLADVAAPVVVAANGKSTPAGEADAGFSAPPLSETESAAASAGKDWKPNVWGTGQEAVTTSAATGGDWKPNMWGETTTAAPTITVGDEAPTAVSASPQQTTTATTEKADSSLAVGRTVIDVQSTDNTRAYIPGVTGPDTVPTYEGSITTAVERTEAVLAQIDSTCPNTKVILMGAGQGAQAASIVSKKIGAGEVFPSEKVLGVTLFADPTRAENQPVVASGAESPAGAKEQWGSTSAEGAGVATVTGNTAGAPETGYGAVADRTVSWCAQGDTTCALPEGAPLRTLVANTAEGTQGKAPEQALRHVTDVLAPAVVLGSVETLAEDVNFGSDGFTFNRASSPQETLVGRIATESDREVPQSEMQQRLLASGMKIGGMALAAGVTVAKEVMQPQNLAQIAAASAVSPAAGVGAALLISSGAALDLVSTRTMTTGAVRLADEAQALGIEDDGLAQAAVDAAIGQEVSKSAGTYRTAGATSSGASSADATTQWLLAIVGDSLGRDLGTSPSALPANYDTAAAAAALKEVA